MSYRFEWTYGQFVYKRNSTTESKSTASRIDDLLLTMTTLAMNKSN